MKKQSVMIRMFAALLCTVMILPLAIIPASAAKENFLNVSSAGVTGIDAPAAGKKGDYTAEVVNTGVYTIENIDYYERATDKLHPSTSAFQYDTEYYVLVTIKTKSAYYFVTSQSTGEPTAAVSCNGDTAMVVDVGEDNAHTIGIKYFFPKTEKDPNPVQSAPGYLIDHVGIIGLAEPKTNEKPSYLFSGYSHSSYTRDSDVNDEYYVNGVCWSFAGGRSLACTGETFLPDETYQVTIRLVPKPGYQFATKANGDTAMTASINGKTVEIIGNAASAKLTYTFKKTEKFALTEAAVTDIDAPAVGQKPDYTASYGSSYGAANENTASTQNGITWYNETDRKPVNTASSFEAGKVYTVQVSIWPDDGEIFQYSDGAYRVSGTINGKKAEIMGRGEYEIILCYTFPKLEEPKHEHSPLKVDEVKANCSAEGRKAYYFCPECGKFFEDAQCTKEITDISRWGVIPAAGHTGGKATCAEKAKCKTCGASYGEFTEHNYGSGWDYKDASGHAHTCKVCGTHDTVQAHSGGTAKCGEKTKCAECKAEYGEIKAHVWSTAWDYNDTKGHAHKCTVCGEHDSVQSHTGGTADCRNKAKCSACGTEYGKTGEHKWGTEWDYTDTKGHAHKCIVCGEHDTVQAHAGGTADCQNKARCASCKAEYGKTGDHQWGTAWEYTSAAGHAHICTICGDHDSVVKHTPGPAATETSEQLCTSCNYVIEPKKQHKHQMIRVNAVDAACTTDGKKQYYTCSSCGLISSDSKGAKEISDPDTLIIPASGHKDSKWQSDADCHWKECTVKGCGAVTAEKAAHEFNKSGKCTVCGYQSTNTPETSLTVEKETEKETEAETEAETKSEEITVIPDNPDTPETSDSSDISTEETVPNQDTAEVNDPEPVPDDGNSDHGTPWMLLIAAAAAVVVCIVVITVVIVKRNTKK